jgi:hypothetical protein
MVLSKLNPEVDYEENSTLNKSDENITSQAWYYNLYNNNIIIALGKEWIQDNDLVTLPIYLISPEDDKVLKQIGLFEMTHETYYANLETDDDGDKILNINNLDEPLIYNRETLMSSLAVASPVASPVVPPVVSPVVPPVASTLPEQTKEMSESEYTKNPSGAWVNKFLNTAHFKIKDVAGDGNCFFYVVRDAMKTVGKNYTLTNLRQMLLEYPDLEKVYKATREPIKAILSDIESNKNKYTECTEKLKSMSVKTKGAKEKYKKDCEAIQEEIKNSNQLLVELDAERIKDLDTFEKYKQYVLTSKCWAAAWSIAQIEQKLNIKVIIFSNEEYKPIEGKKKDTDQTESVILCTQSEVTKPDFYILANYVDNNHYQLLYFKDTLAFKFHQLPYILRSKLVERCMRGDKSVGWNKIEDFKKFKLEIQHKTPTKKSHHSQTKKKSPSPSPAPKKQTKKQKDKDNVCHKLSEEECKILTESCVYKKGQKRQYCAKIKAKK